MIAKKTMYWMFVLILLVLACEVFDAHKITVYYIMYYKTRLTKEHRGIIYNGAIVDVPRKWVILNMNGESMVLMRIPPSFKSKEDRIYGFIARARAMNDWPDHARLDDRLLGKASAPQVTSLNGRPAYTMLFEEAIPRDGNQKILFCYGVPSLDSEICIFGPKKYQKYSKELASGVREASGQRN